ncbi:YdiU family protein [Rhodoblastus acidophilus]|uniref:Protein nucleotidyltransferase YdiU n=1 Tax=Candidatus Rhodoblastus alkanivorans TaxID=2954117 RepID=A0ABS9Z4U9_9HYPH|nr:YdiU family protein [Candidatus Rhodoblastus alkanivorans]MCI4679892.1 YdiU family protein [Candidatus Rhodoblastus alkanivorans]MCI4682705.1 YdiU family protein [Candidatus Rhodoblastus alkanivorans]MDI4640012.1 YdiU family protein [Rhodoblastus acidophilus]
MTATSHFLRETSYRALPPEFFAAATVSPAPAPEWVVFNDGLAAELGLPENAATPGLLQLLSGGPPSEGRENIALAYSGHQFGQWNPLLGDGRAAMIGEIVAPDGVTYDVHLKGSGPTKFARRGDGRATLSAMLREYIVSEAMAGLKIPTTRALAVVATGAPVYRETAHPGAVLTRIARSHVRVGTFEYAANEDARRNQGPVLTRALADHCIARHFPEFAGQKDGYLAFYASVVARQARLVAQWMLVGFIHGVMNTDNMSIAGESIDFGPCAFMDAYNRRQVFSSIDAAGRYAFNRQAPIASWNLARLAEALLPLFDDDDAVALRRAQETLEGFQPAYVAALGQGLERKLGLKPRDAANEDFIAGMWRLLENSKADFTLFFRRLTLFAAGSNAPAFLDLFAETSAETREEAAKFLADWRGLTAGDDFPSRLALMRASNPIVIARNHRVEQALNAANEGDLAPLLRLCAALKTPFEDPAPPEKPEDDLEAPPRPEERVVETFCGT